MSGSLAGISGMFPQAPQPQAPLVMLNQVLEAQARDLANQNAQKELEGKVAASQVLQGAIDPKTGELDYARAAKGLFSHPQASYVAPAIVSELARGNLTAKEAIRTGLATTLEQNNSLLGSLSSLIGKDRPTQGEVADLIKRQEEIGALPKPLADAYRARIASDVPVLQPDGTMKSPLKSQIESHAYQLADATERIKMGLGLPALEPVGGDLLSTIRRPGQPVQIVGQQPISMGADTEAGLANRLVEYWDGQQTRQKPYAEVMRLYGRLPQGARIIGGEGASSVPAPSPAAAGGGQGGTPSAPLPTNYPIPSTTAAPNLSEASVAHPGPISAGANQNFAEHMKQLSDNSTSFMDIYQRANHMLELLPEVGAGLGADKIAWWRRLVERLGGKDLVAGAFGTPSIAKYQEFVKNGLLQDLSLLKLDGKATDLTDAKYTDIQKQLSDPELDPKALEKITKYIKRQSAARRIELRYLSERQNDSDFRPEGWADQWLVRRNKMGLDAAEPDVDTPMRRLGIIQ
jgi:hypothetical protein